MDKNSKQYTFAVLGGDKRQAIIAERLLLSNHKVKLFGLGEVGQSISGAEICSDVSLAVSGSDFLLLPLPVSRDKINLNLSSDCTQSQIKLADIILLASSSGASAILGGMMTDEFERLASIKGICAYDYYKSEELQRKNALPSAEGALMLAMEHTEINIDGMNVLVSGYGKIGACLSLILKKLGANVTVAARRDESLCDAALSGLKTVKIDKYSDNEGLRYAFQTSDVVFNTIPSIVFNEKIVRSKLTKPLYIEIASNPGGIDRFAARDAGVNIINAPSLPGKYAPINAGEYIFETIMDFLKSEGYLSY